MAASAPVRALLRAKDIEALPEEARVHALDRESVRHTRSLGDAAGLATLGVHLVRLRQGRRSSVHHFHHHDEEWIYILSGCAMAEIGDEQFEVSAGDFMGFVAGSAPHNLFNPNAEDLVYLVGGNRLPYDVCDYPRIRMRRYRTNGVSEYVSLDALKARPSK